jgi:hypothetical protein
VKVLPGGPAWNWQEVPDALSWQAVNSSGKCTRLSQLRKPWLHCSKMKFHEEYRVLSAPNLGTENFEDVSGTKFQRAKKWLDRGDLRIHVFR